MLIDGDLCVRSLPVSGPSACKHVCIARMARLAFRQRPFREHRGWIAQVQILVVFGLQRST